MRKFYIENEKNERFSLWGNRVFLTNPNGLGIKHDASYIRIGNSFLRNKTNVAQAKIGGTIEFVDPNANKRFKEFYAFCAASTNLHLVYDAGDGVEYIRDIDVSEIGKTERTGGTLPISVNFACKSLYYLKNNNRFTFGSITDEKRYDYRYDTKYGDYGTYQAYVKNNGHADAPFECNIFGYCVNPSVLIRRNGAILFEVKFPIAVHEGEYIRYSSRDGMLEATLVAKDGSESNLMPKLDISKDNFFKIPVGESEIVFRSESESTNVITATIFKMFEVV